MILTVASRLKMRFAGAWTSTLSMTSCLPSGSRSGGSTNPWPSGSLGGCGVAARGVRPPGRRRAAGGGGRRGPRGRGSRCSVIADSLNLLQVAVTWCVDQTLPLPDGAAGRVFISLAASPTAGPERIPRSSVEWPAGAESSALGSAPSIGSAGLTGGKGAAGVFRRSCLAGFVILTAQPSGQARISTSPIRIEIRRPMETVPSLGTAPVDATR